LVILSQRAAWRNQAMIPDHQPISSSFACKLARIPPVPIPPKLA
jgi:hypothetical protein